MPSDGTWLECNGQSTTNYPALATIVGSNVPNYCGMFLRGYGHQTFSQNNGSLYGITSTSYSSGQLGALQGDSIRNITGSLSGYDFQGDGTPYSGGALKMEESTAGYSGIGYGGGERLYTFDASRITPTTNEVRPVNIAVRYLIKAQ